VLDDCFDGSHLDQKFITAAGNRKVE
jgi:hypothetical protein